MNKFFNKNGAFFDCSSCSRWAIKLLKAVSASVSGLLPLNVSITANWTHKYSELIIDQELTSLQVCTPIWIFRSCWWYPYHPSKMISSSLYNYIKLNKNYSFSELKNWDTPNLSIWLVNCFFFLGYIILEYINY